MELTLLHPPVPEPFAAMTYPAYRHLLALTPGRKLPHEGGSPPVQPVAVGLLSGEEPVGLMLMVLPLVAGERPELLSVFVGARARGQGWGTRLVEAAETVATNAGFAELSVVWTEGATGTDWLAKVLERRGWASPERRSLAVEMRTEQTLALPWLDRFPVREGGEIVPVAAVAEAEWAHLQRLQEAEGWIAADLVPWRYLEEGFERATSVALRGRDGILGWVINHALSPLWLRFTCSFIRKDLGRRARILPLYSESIHRMAAAGFARCTFVAPARHPSMVRFVEAHVAPWASRVRWTWGSTRQLGRAGGVEGVVPQQLERRRRA